MKRIHYDIPKLVRIDGTTRLYETPAGNRYPSVTAIVSILSKDYIDQWKATVGGEKAAEISRRAATRGTLIHENCENYLLGKPQTFTMFQNEERKMFNSLKPILESITELHAIETQLYSHALRAAGTVDIIARMDNGELCILDWKTSSRYKSKEDIHGYFIQCAAYSYMFYELTGVLVKNIKIAMTTEEFGLLVFDEPVMPWLKEFKELRERFGVQTGL